MPGGKDVNSEDLQLFIDGKLIGPVTNFEPKDINYPKNAPDWKKESYSVSGEFEVDELNLKKMQELIGEYEPSFAEQMEIIMRQAIFMADEELWEKLHELEKHKEEIEKRLVLGMFPDGGKILKLDGKGLVGFFPDKFTGVYDIKFYEWSKEQEENE